ncbi:MAG TPA: peptidoglycan DD-metalloendopeptidase family protein [Longimicrobiaceae bacterium]|nr:peptidoglycan DD-metalloendopeptidase family protein [Longimicrobiaceae bacterium]
MARSQWTVMLVPHDNERVRSIQISSRSVRVALSTFLFLSFALAIFGVGFFVKQGQHIRAQRLERENELLAAEVDQMRSQMETLSESIEDLSKKGEKYRVVAGLPEIDPEVERVGIGGPGTETLQSAGLFRLNPERGKKVFETSSNLSTLMRRASLLRSSMVEALDAMESNRERLAATPSIAPSSGHLSSLFSRGRYHPVLRITRPHEGIDIAAPVGEPILAPAAGRIRYAGYRSGGYGNMVEIDHGFGYVTRFAHASRILVREGQEVKRGDEIARVGATGLVSGPHLHYEVEVNGRPADPLNFIIEDAIPD